MKKCANCNNECENNSKFCNNCGYNFDNELICPICKAPIKIGQKRCNKCLTPLPDIKKQLPEELKKFNWGAFGFTWIWGLAYKYYWPLTCFIPFIGIILAPIYSLYLGFKGNEIAWQNSNQTTVEEFNKNQKTWATAFVITISALLTFAIMLYFIINKTLITPNKKVFDSFVEIYNSQDTEKFCQSNKECLKSFSNLYNTTGKLTNIKIKEMSTENKSGFIETKICATANSQKQNKNCRPCLYIRQIEGSDEAKLDFKVDF